MTDIPYVNQDLYHRIKSRHGELVTRREKYDDQTDVICELLRPDLIKGKVGEKDEGIFAHPEIIEGTGPYSVLVWQRGFIGNMISRKAEWFRDILKEPPQWTGVTFIGNDEINKWLQNTDDHMTEVYKRSNFYDVMPSFALDGGTVGAPVILRERDELQDKIICKVPDYAARWLDKDIFGRDNVLHVLWRWNAIQAAAFFGKDQLPLVVKHQYDNGNHYEETEYLQVIYGAGDPIYEGLKEFKRPVHPWLEHFICLSSSTSQAEQKVLKPKLKGPGYFSRPFSTWHYHRNWHEVYSRTMGWFAVYDLRGLNALWEALFEEAELSSRPPVWSMETMRGLLDLTPSGENYARSADEYNTPPVFLDRKSRYQVTIDFTERLQKSVERWFHVPLLMMVNELAFSRNQPETKYGIMRMEAERMGQLAPQVETYENQVLGDNHDAFIDMEVMAEPAYPWGRLPEPPEIVQEYSDGSMDVEFVGQLSMAQMRDRTIMNFYRNIGISETVFNLAPETIKKIRWGPALERVLEAGNFAQADIVPDDEWQQIIQAMQQRALQQEIAENAPKIAQAAKNLQKKTEEESPLNKLLTGTAV